MVLVRQHHNLRIFQRRQRQQQPQHLYTDKRFPATRWPLDDPDSVFQAFFDGLLLWRIEHAVWAVRCVEELLERYPLTTTHVFIRDWTIEIRSFCLSKKHSKKLPGTKVRLKWILSCTRVVKTCFIEVLLIGISFSYIKNYTNSKDTSGNQIKWDWSKLCLGRVVKDMFYRSTLIGYILSII